MLAEKRAYLFGAMVVENLTSGYLSPFFYLSKIENNEWLQRRILINRKNIIFVKSKFEAK